MSIILPPAFDLGEPDFLDPIEMLPPNDPTDTIMVYIETVQGEPSFKDLGEPDYIEDDLCDHFPEPKSSFMVQITITSIEKGRPTFYEDDADTIIDEPFEIKGQ